MTITISLFFREIASRLSAFRNDIVRGLSQTNLSYQYISLNNVMDDKIVNKNQEKLNFEEALAEIDAIVSKLESGELSLDDSLQYFQRGMELINFCSAKLEGAEKKLKIIMEGEKGDFRLEDSE